MLWSAILFALAALGGLVLAGIRLSGRPYPPIWLALAHGALAATALGMLIYQATAGIELLAQIALGMFALAAIGGLFLFLAFHVRGKPLPILLVIGHGSLAVAGLVVLWIDVLKLV